MDSPKQNSHSPYAVTTGTIVRTSLQVMLLLCLLVGARSALAATCFTATTAAGTSGSNLGTNTASLYQNLCWLDFTGFSLTTAESAAGQNFSFSLADGSTLSFNVTLTFPAATPPQSVVAAATPSFGGAPLGEYAYGGIGGLPVIYVTGFSSGSNTVRSYLISVTAIQFHDPSGALVTSGYQVVAADGERTNFQSAGTAENLVFTTSTGTWTTIDNVTPPASTPLTLSGAGTATVTETGTTTGATNGYIFAAANPTAITASVGTVTGSKQGVAFAVISTFVTLNKTIAGSGRLNAADQFKYSIANKAGAVPSGATQTTSGIANSGFTNAIIGNVFPGDTLTLSEGMAAGSVSPLSSYTATYNCTSTVNPTISGTGTSFTISNPVPSLTAQGQLYNCTFTNTPNPNLSITKTDSNGGTYSPGGTNIYTITISNAGGAVSGTSAADILPKGATLTTSITAASCNPTANCSGSGHTAPFAGDGVTNILSGLILNLPAGSSGSPAVTTITIPVSYSNNVSSY